MPYLKNQIMKKLSLIFMLLCTAGILTAQLPEPGFTIDEQTAIVITDPQIDFLSPDGVTWGVVGKSVEANNTVENLERLFATAASNGKLVFISPHYYYPHDYNWEFEGTLEVLMHNIKMFNREGPLTTDGFTDSGADWMPQYRKYIEKDNVIVYGPESNDLILQLRKRKVDKVVLAGMSANLCVEAHMRELLEAGFEVSVVTDATAAALLPDMDAYSAALINFRMMASHLYTTDEVVNELNALGSK
jgi:nicotinamidase-related amidase